SRLPVIIAGSVAVELICNINGMGLLVYQSIMAKDFNVVMGVTLMTGVLTMIGILIADIAYAVLMCLGDNPVKLSKLFIVPGHDQRLGPEQRQVQPRVNIHVFAVPLLHAGHFHDLAWRQADWLKQST
ncbi:MAG: ABC transporter permease subunit, partial [Desulfobacterales bacterium]|nr:ABC transporter permease subunit [Desulfobacterales bacterium]